MVKQISREELVRMVKSGEKFTLVDVLGKDSYAKEHIPGAISVPLVDLEREAARLLGKEDTVVVYCASFECKASTAAAEKLLKLGYAKVLDYKGGLKDYRDGGLTLEGSIYKGASCGSCCDCGQAFF